MNPNGGYVKLRISNDSKLLNSNTAIKNETSGIIELEINESQVITKQDKSNIELNQTQGNIVLYHSIFNNSIKFTKTQKVQIHGCQFIKTEPGTNAIEVVDSDLSMSGENRIEGFSRSVLFNGPNNHFVLVDNFNFSNENLTSTSDNSIFISNAFTCNIGNSSGVINKKGIEIQNSKITRIRNTSINILGSSPAIRIGSIDFDIFNNVITGTGTQNGIEIKSSSTSANLISSNSFNNLAVGIKNFGDNGTKTMGLDLRCNLFNNSNFDIVSDNDLTPTIGNENSSAGNNFFYNSEQFGDLILTQGNFNNNGVSKYFYRNQDFEKPLNTNSSNSIFEILLSPNCLIPLPTNDQVGVFPWIYNDPPEFPQDPGDPDDDDFVPPCNWFWPPNIIPDSIPSMIIPQITPYFPNTPIDIVYDVINNSEYFSEEEIVSILENNPGVLNDDYIYWLLFKSGCFSINGANRVLHNYFESDNRIDIINQYAENYNLKYGSIRYNILESVLNGMFSESFFRICVAKKHSFKKTYDIAESYYREGRYDISLNLVEGINNVYLSDPYNIEERNKYIQIMNIIIPHLMSSSNLENITTYELGELKIIAEHDYGVATIKAREILDYYLNMIYNETPIKYLYEPISFRTENRSVIKNNFRVLISPNPVKDVLNIEFDVKFTGKKKVITIVNSSGNINLVIETIENEIGVNALNINSGIYSIMIKIDGRLVSTEKMVKI